MVAKSIAKMYTNIHKPTDYSVCVGNNCGMSSQHHFLRCRMLL